ncbi:hypothetical protein RN001_014768 [Aquatica leii]|uniref:UDP-glucuronosyltransferase n=1 Tax=Aquatica leii TaxID=1421715 RepID=A0AAN7NYF2_9COLE|nr:hypothetical protein RN001_014768 [Aquatica leii]
MFVCKVLCCVFTVLVSFGDAARILGVVPSPSYSHQIVFQKIWKELSLRGHQVTTITTDPINDHTLVNLTEINMRHLYKSLNVYVEKVMNSSFSEFMPALLDILEHTANNFLSHKPVQDLIKNETEKFDVVMVEYEYRSMLAFAQRFNAPLIVISSMDAQSSLCAAMGSPTHLIVYPDIMSPLEDNKSIFDRLQLVTFSLVFKIPDNVFIKPAQQSIVNKYFGKNYPTLEKIEESVSLALVNSDPIFHKVKPLVPTIVQLGGGFHRTETKPLPKELKNLLDAAENGFIYFSLGSNFKSKNLSKGTRDVLIETFAELPYTVLWKFEEDNIPNKPKNLITSKWFPQQDIFKHPKIKLFITQGGLQSTDEAIYDHIPMIGLPIFFDQKFNVNKMVNKGFGLSLDYKTMSKDEFKATILEVINNPKYRNKIKELAELALDQPMTGFEKAVWWIEYVIRHNGTKHLRRWMGKQNKSIQSTLLDEKIQQTRHVLTK